MAFLAGALVSALAAAAFGAALVAAAFLAGALASALAAAAFGAALVAVAFFAGALAVVLDAALVAVAFLAGALASTSFAGAAAFLAAGFLAAGFLAAALVVFLAGVALVALAASGAATFSSSTGFTLSTIDLSSFAFCWAADWAASVEPDADAAVLLPLVLTLTVTLVASSIFTCSVTDSTVVSGRACFGLALERDLEFALLVLSLISEELSFDTLAAFLPNLSTLVLVAWPRSASMREAVSIKSGSMSFSAFLALFWETFAPPLSAIIVVFWVFFELPLRFTVTTVDFSDTFSLVEAFLAPLLALASFLGSAFLALLALALWACSLAASCAAWAAESKALSSLAIMAATLLRDRSKSRAME